VFDFSLLVPYVSFFLSLVAAGLGAPIPEELPVVGAGVWASLASVEQTYGLFRWLVLPVCILGVVISDGLLYCVGRHYGTRLLDRPFFKKLLPPERRQHIEDNYHKHGVKVLLFARFLPGIRSPMFIMAGVMRMPLRKFLVADGIYAIPGVSLLFFLAWWFGDTFKRLVEAFHHQLDVVKPLLILAALLGIAGFLLYRFLRHPVSMGDPEEMPLVGPVIAAHDVADEAARRDQEAERQPGIQPSSLPTDPQPSPERT
jgi:membrane protein DedA with SNARE-associated domain